MIWKSRNRFVKHAIKSDAPRKILDVGFLGAGEPRVHEAILKVLTQNDELIGIDTNEIGISPFLDKCQGNVSYKLMSIFRTSFQNNTFDYVLLLDVFEHLINPYLALEEIHRILKAGGSLVMEYPNPLSLSKTIHYVKQKDLLDEKYLNMFRGAPDHKLFPHPVCLAIYLNQIGFRTNEIGFLKFAITNIKIIDNVLKHIGLFEKFSSEIGIVATKIS